MAKKANLERDRDAYLGCATRAADGVRTRAFGAAVDACVASLPALPGYADYERRFAKVDPVPLPTLNALFRYAPPLFRRDAAHAAAEFAAANPKLGKKLGRDLAAEAAACRAALSAAARLWGEFAARADGAPLPPWRAAAATPGERDAVDTWDRLGLLAGAGSRGPDPRFAAGMSGTWVGLCAACGAAHRGPKLALLSDLTCQACGAAGAFVVQEDQEGAAR